MKCDETKPQCQRCLSTGRVCDGPRLPEIIIIQHRSFQNAKQVLLPLNRVDPAPWLTLPGERRAFSFYLQRAAPDLAGPIDADLWFTLLPQLAEPDQVVRHALFAISHFIEHPVRGSMDGQIVIQSLTRKHVAGLNWHAQALSADTNQNHNLAMTDLMLRCVLFSSLEFQQNNFRVGLRLLRTGFTVLAPLLTATNGDMSSKGMQNHPVVRTLMPMYMRNACLLFTSWNDFCVQTSPIPTPKELELIVFQLMCTVYGVLKDTFLALKYYRISDIAELLSKQKSLELQQSILTGKISQAVAQHSADNERLQALQDHCYYIRFWIEMLIFQCSRDSTLIPDEFLTIVLEQCRSIAKDAGTLRTAAARTTYFLDCVIVPPAYLVAVFAPNASVRNQALRLMGQREIEPSSRQLHALILTRDGGDPFGMDEASSLSAFQVYYGEKDEKSGWDKVYHFSV